MSAPAAGGEQHTHLTAFDYLLYGVVLLGWSTSWIGMKLQVGVVAPEVSVIWRFIIAASVMFVSALVVRAPLRFPLADHARFVLFGALLFSTNFTLFYYGAGRLPSGLLSVVFSLASVFNVFLAALLLGTRPTPRLVVGGVAGFAGIALMFWPQLLGTSFDAAAATGLALCVCGTVCFCLGNIASVRMQRRQLPKVSSNAWGMFYGVVLLTTFATLHGSPFIVDWRPSYIISLIWLAIPSTVLAFAAYVTLLGRIGPGRAGYVTVMFPVIALAISTVFEGYVWTLPAIAGLVLVLGGNLLVLGGSRR